MQQEKTQNKKMRDNMKEYKTIKYNRNRIQITAALTTKCFKPSRGFSISLSANPHSYHPMLCQDYDEILKKLELWFHKSTL